MFLNPDADLESVYADWSERYPGLSVLSHRELREIITRIFRETFAVTHSIKWLGLFVAVCGLALSLFCILLENRENLLIYRKLGMGRTEIARTTAWEGLGLSAIGLVCGLVLSIILGALLVFVINKQSFGWTLRYVVPKWEMLLFGVFILFIGFIVAYWVGLRNHVSVDAIQWLDSCCNFFGCCRRALHSDNLRRNLDDDGYRIPPFDPVFNFPRDHGSHPDYKIEWWYLIGHLNDSDGREYGFQVTFFRVASRPWDPRSITNLEFDDSQVFMTHVALTDVEAGEYHQQERSESIRMGRSREDRIAVLPKWELDP